MKLDELVETLEGTVHFPAELEFDRIGVIQSTNVDIRKLAVCVNLTDYVMQETKRLGVNFLVVHHGHGDEVKQRVQQLGIGAYGLHLALDVGALIDGFANVFDLQNIKPLTFVYKGTSVHRGALLGNAKSKTPTVGYFVDHLFHFFSHYLGQNNMVISSYNVSRELNPVIVATGLAIRREFLEQVAQYSPRLFIAGGVKNGAEDYAKELGIALMTIGDFESHYPGMQAFANVLGLKMELYRIFKEGQRHSSITKNPVLVIPDYKIK